MTIRKHWLLYLTVIAIVAVVINTIIISLLIDRKFVNYISDNYDKHVEEIIDYTSDALSNAMNPNELAIELQTHLDDPIKEIMVYNKNNILIVRVRDGIPMMEHRGMNNMMGRMMGTGKNETEDYALYDGDTQIGTILILRKSSIEQSVASIMFKSSLVQYSLISIFFVLLLAIILGIIISKKMSKELIETARQAHNIHLGKDEKIEDSNVKEVQVIRQSLIALDTKLKLKQKSRKQLIDSLVHQSRTPLTILRTHIEGVQDGIIELKKDELNICEDQIENLTAIISNMSQLIEAEKDQDQVITEQFELGKVIGQIVNGLRAQYEQKNIQLKLNKSDKVLLETDKYKLSQAIYNILTNAYKYTEASGEVKVDVENKENEIAISIKDTGIGMDKKEVSRIFDAYYRGDNVSRIKGEGIGLFVAKENINSIGGRISVESAKGVGSAFVIVLPR